MSPDTVSPSSESKVGGMNRARRRGIWAKALVDALRAVLARVGGRHLPDPDVRSAIQGLFQPTHTEMDQATDSDKRDELYERHRALSEIIQELDRQVEEEQKRRNPAPE